MLNDSKQRFQYRKALKKILTPTTFSQLSCKYHITVHFPYSMRFETAKSVLERYCLDIKRSLGIRLGALGLIVQGEATTHAHLIVVFASPNGFESVPLSPTQMESIKLKWHPCGTKGAGMTEITRIFDLEGLAKYIASPKNFKLHERNGESLYEIFDFDKKFLEKLGCKVLNTGTDFIAQAGPSCEKTNPGEPATDSNSNHRNGPEAEHANRIVRPGSIEPIPALTGSRASDLWCDHSGHGVDTANEVA